ncbi:MAG: hypothetical protein GY835_04180 [bacterium]|nr:hypothetical protein [bacterium]
MSVLRCLAIMSVFMCVGCVSLAAPLDWLDRLAVASPEASGPLADSLLAALPGGTTPFLEDSLAHFIYRENHAKPCGSVVVAGDMTHWRPTLALTRVGRSPIWHAAFACPADTRVDYKFVLDGGEWILDPLNPRTVLGGFGPNSELTMPGWSGTPVKPADELPACGGETIAAFPCPQLNGERRIEIVTPPGYDGVKPHPVLIVHDGLEYISLGNLKLTLGRLSLEHPDLSLPICVCIPPGDRIAEYAGAKREAFGRFIADAVIPFVNEHYATSPTDRTMWGCLGASNGANVSLYLACTHPDLFGNLLLMSPYLPADLQDRFAALPSGRFRVYMNWGTYDLPQLIPLIETFETLLDTHGDEHLAKRYNDGHSWGFWRATLGEGLQFLFREQ